MQKPVWIALMACCYGITASAQSDKTTPATEKMLTDIFKGQVLLDNTRYITQLVLTHCRYCDEGKFILQETKVESKAGDKPIEIKGDWTVIEGDAENQYATVVEIDAGKDTLYFLRWEEGNLQKLDAQLRAISPVKKYLLRKVK
jgi:hypothetical protein